MATLDLEKDIIPYIDTIEGLLTSDFWNNLLMDCTKNELLILWLLYKKKEVNMTQVAECIHAPLNTATGIVSRMEKKDLIFRSRSEEDKRVVTITFGENGRKQINQIIQQMIYYGSKVLATFTPQETQLLTKMLQSVLEVMKEEKLHEESKPQIRKIEIM